MINIYNKESTCNEKPSLTGSKYYIKARYIQLFKSLGLVWYFLCRKKSSLL